jgi:hypothetical protein
MVDGRYIVPREALTARILLSRRNTGPKRMPAEGFNVLEVLEGRDSVIVEGVSITVSARTEDGRSQRFALPMSPETARLVLNIIHQIAPEVQRDDEG